MKIRIMGTSEECAQAQQIFSELGKDSLVKSYSVSNPYPNRGSNNQYRVYVDIDFYDDVDIDGTPALISAIQRL